MVLVKPTHEELVKEQIKFYENIIEENNNYLEEQESKLIHFGLKELKEECQLKNSQLQTRIELLNKVLSNIEEPTNFTIDALSYKDLIEEQISAYQQKANKNIECLKVKLSVLIIKIDAGVETDADFEELKEIRKNLQFYNACLKRRIELLNRVYSKLN